MIRQGDVLLREVEALPDDARPLAPEGPVVLAEGEVTGHAHVLDGTPDSVHVHRGRQYLVLAAEATVRHEEHAAVTLAPGIWEVRRQREYRPEGSDDVVD